MTWHLAIDPGMHTGYAVFENGELAYSKMRMMNDFIDWFEGELLLSTLDAVICEDFIINTQTGRKSQDGRYALEVIGYVRHTCRRTTNMHGVTVPFILQVPSKRTFASDDKLKRLGWYDTNPHARDAVRHGVVYLVDHGMLKPSRLVG